MLLLIFCLIGLVHSGVGQIFQERSCPTVTAKVDFDANKYLGRWRLHEYTATDPLTDVCLQMTYSPGADSREFKIETTKVNSNILVTNESTAVISEDGSGQIVITSPDTPEPTTFLILGTDYESYSFVYRCINLEKLTEEEPDRSQVWAWKLSRDSEFSEDAHREVDLILEENNIEDLRFLNDKQDSSSCFYYPPPTGGPVIFRGLCDDNINVIENFDAAKYLGLWREIESFPSNYQKGSCIQATYSLGPAGVVVYNTMVINETLDTITGSATASVDGTGKLTVTFPTASEPTIYSILDTDYDSYSLVYNCKQIDAERKQVTSWKLSRTPTLTAAATTAINDIISSTQDLHQQYYEHTSQSIEDCFYVPEYTPNQAIRFRGRCENFITPLEQFDTRRFLDGVWHEIERYPSDLYSGACVSTNYQLINQQVNYVDTSVYDIEDGREERGYATAGNDGRLVKTSLNGTTQTLFVLDTDYDSYALVLSCENGDDDYMKVWSAKHSRLRQLTQAAENSIAAAVSSNKLLRDEFYQIVSQNDTACFFYPEPNNETVVLPGQCDEVLPTQEGFDVSKFLGTWYQIERYPYPEVKYNATCIGTRFRQRASNELDVLNWESTDGELETIAGVASVVNGSLTIYLQTDPNNSSITTEAVLRVLSTNYDTYTFAYTCANVGRYHRTVVAVKLSRTRTLPAQASTAIDEYMSGRYELDQRYFLRVEHSDDCKDPNSSYLVKSSIIITIVCVFIQTWM